MNWFQKKIFRLKFWWAGLKRDPITFGKTPKDVQEVIAAKLHRPVDLDCSTNKTLWQRILDYKALIVLRLEEYVWWQELGYRLMRLHLKFGGQVTVPPIEYNPFVEGSGLLRAPESVRMAAAIANPQEQVLGVTHDRACHIVRSEGDFFFVKPVKKLTR